MSEGKSAATPQWAIKAMQRMHATVCPADCNDPECIAEVNRGAQFVAEEAASVGSVAAPKAQPEHVCKFPEPKSAAEVWTCYDCGVIFQYDEVSCTWEATGEVEEIGAPKAQLLLHKQEDLLSALRAIRLCLQCDAEPDKGDYHTARQWLRDHDRYEGNLQELAVPLEVAEYAIRLAEACAPKAGEPPQELVISLCRELYDRFMMGGWEPQDAHAMVADMLGDLPQEQELRSIDAILERRPALASSKTRTEKVALAISAAAKLDGLLRRYGSHVDGCCSRPDCSCGWDQVLDWLRGAGETPAERWIPVAERLPEVRELSSSDRSGKVFRWNVSDWVITFNPTGLSGNSSCQTRYHIDRILQYEGDPADFIHHKGVTKWLPLPPGAGSKGGNV